MSVRQMAIVWARSKQSGSALLLLLAIADFANDEGYAWPSIPTLARKVRLTERSTQRLLEDLETTGEISVRHGAGPIPVSTAGGIQRTNLYQVVVEGRAATSPPLQGEGHPDKGEGRHDAKRAKGVTVASPNPSLLHPSLEPSKITTLAPSRDSGSAPPASSPSSAITKQVSWTSDGFSVPPYILDRWRRTFPAVNVAQEILKAYEWTVANPEKRKQNWYRFLYNWLRKTQERVPTGRFGPGRERPLAATDPAARAKEIADDLHRRGLA